MAVPEFQPAPASDRFERNFVWLVWFAMGVALIWYTWLYGRNMPFWDDWPMVPVLSGNEPATIGWIWGANNGHRFPVVRLLLLAQWRTGLDARWVMVLTDGVLAAAAAVLIRAARRLRGRVSYTDAAIPLALMGWGMFENIIFDMQLFFIAASTLVLVIVALALGEWRGRLACVAGIGAALVLLPTQGGMGLVMTPLMMAWVGCAVVARRRDDDATARRDCAVLIASCAVAALIMVAYVIGMDSPSFGHDARTLTSVTSTGLKALSLAIGPVSSAVWPASVVYVLVVVLAGFRFAVAAVARRSADSLRALAVVASIGAFSTVIGVIAFTRAAMGSDQGFSDRYAMFAAPLMLSAYLATLLFESDALGRFLRMSMLLVLTAALASNTELGRAYGIGRAAYADSITAAIESGAPPSVVAERTWDGNSPNVELIARGLQMMRVTNSGPYASAAGFTNRECQPAEVPLTFLDLHDATRQGDAFQGTGEDPYYIYGLPQPTYVCSVAVTYRSIDGPPGPEELTVWWVDSRRNDYADARRVVRRIERSDAEHTVVIPIYDIIDRVRIDPDRRPSHFQLIRAEFLVMDDRR